MHWEELLQEILKHRMKSGRGVYHARSCGESIDNKKPSKIYLGEEYRNIYFTGREAEVMVQLMQGKTLNAAADNLDLSPRTIEFYVKNMKAKLACRTKSELIGKVFASDFVKNIDFITSLLAE